MSLLNFRPYVIRIAGVWALCILLTAMLASIWYIFQPSFTYVAIVLNSAMESQGINSTNTDNIVTILRLGINIGIPIMILSLWGWAIVSSQKTEWRGYYAQ